MSIDSPTLRHERRLAGFAATLALHLALLYGWHLMRQAAPHNDADPARIQWVKIAPPRPVKALPQPALQARAMAAPKRHAAPPAIAPPRPAISESDPLAAPVGAAPPARSAAEIMAQARKDMGKIGKELAKEFPGPRIKAPPDSPQMRLARGIEEANELAPPKWYEPAKIKEIIDPGGYGRRRYRVITSGGTTCWTIESNHAPDGQDNFKSRSTPKVTNCPEHEQAATNQKW